VFVVVEGLPEADPDIEYSQAAAQAAKKASGDEGTKPGEREQKIIVGPLGCPGQDHEQDAGDGADQYEKKDGGSVQPELQAVVGLWSGVRRRRVEECGTGLAGRGLGRRRSRAVLDGELGISGHWALRCGDRRDAGVNQDPSLRSG
jgi:hypothetical protein